MNDDRLYYWVPRPEAEGEREESDSHEYEHLRLNNGGYRLLFDAPSSRSCINENSSSLNLRLTMG